MKFPNFGNLEQDPITNLIFFLLFLWSTVWKGLALWHAAADKQRNWFIAILVLNTVGLLEIGYLFFFAKEKLKLKDISLRLNSIIKR